MVVAMPKRMMWVEWEDDADLSRSRKNPGNYSPLTRDGDNNLGHVTLSDIGEDEDEKYGSSPDSAYSDGTDEYASDWEDEERRRREEQELIVLGIVAILTAVEKAAPHVQRWWRRRARPFLGRTRTAIRKRRESSAQDDDIDLPEVVPPALTEASEESHAALDAYLESLSSAEARARFVAAVVARLFSEEQIRLLSEARIDDEGAALDLASAVESLTPQQLSDSLTLMLEANPSWPDEETRAELGRILEGRSRPDVAHIPVPDERSSPALLRRISEQ